MLHVLNLPRSNIKWTESHVLARVNQHDETTVKPPSIVQANDAKEKPLREADLQPLVGKLWSSVDDGDLYRVGLGDVNNLKA